MVINFQKEVIEAIFSFIDEPQTGMITWSKFLAISIGSLLV
jgi:hypothetical protein